jgi:hypothetical protein
MICLTRWEVRYKSLHPELWNLGGISVFATDKALLPELGGRRNDIGADCMGRGERSFKF